MNDKYNNLALVFNEVVDKIAWWIPFRKLRDFIREIYYKINDTNNRINRELEYINFQLFRITPKANIDL